MKKNNTVKFIFLTTLIFILIIIMFSVFHLLQYEGFNPSDDGVIAAQSFRLMHGEIPHKDFIAIRPAGSGYLHLLDFIVPIPMMEAGRWLTVFEYFFYSSCWIFLILIVLNKTDFSRRYPLLTGSLILIAFCLTIQIKQTFPWTTVDAIFFTSFGLTFLFQSIDFSSFKLNKTASAIAALLFMSCAALCRQTFVFPLCISGLAILIGGYHSKKIFPALLAGITGILPILIYFIYLILNSALPDFINQMTGRTELFHTGIFEYGVHLFYTPWLALYLIYAFILFALRFKKNNFQKYLNSADGLTALLISSCSVAMFFSEFQKTIPFVFFWTVLYLSCRLYLAKHRGNFLFLSFASLLLAWTGSISLGDNSPLFCSGILISVIAMQLFLLHEDFVTTFFKKKKKAFQIGSLISALSILSFTIYSQGRFNYRDLPRDQLTETLKEYFPEMGNIHTNKNTRAYYDELLRIKNELHIPQNHLVVLPNNAAIYPLLNSGNPFPVDWAQGNEYIGAKDKMFADIKSAIKTEKLYILVDKMDSKYMFDGFEPFKPDYPFNHEYLPIIETSEICTKANIDSPFFNIYISN